MNFQFDLTPALSKACLSGRQGEGDALFQFRVSIQYNIALTVKCSITNEQFSMLIPDSA